MNTEETLKQIEELQQRCEQYEHINLKLNWDMLRQVPEDGGAQWLVKVEGNLLVGFIGLYGIGSELEICGMVRPGYRRRGIFTGLWQQAQDVLAKGPARSVLLNAPETSQSAAGFLKKLPVSFHHAEYQMKWDSAAAQVQADSAGSAAAGEVTLRPARDDETDLLIALDLDGFGMDQADAAGMYNQIQPGNSEEHVLIEWNGQPAGKMRLYTEDGETWISGFVVDRRLRSRGIGRSSLLQTIERERHHGNSVSLEVALDNPNALKLYESCGFVIQNRQNYYSYNG
ncbi:GNAT family N-acetyltransferase ['Paenibacillus yunnanensis' Narsing Rao et al. 2020]|uniref:GNAT family N-acetyltransferase n=1 Tax=Paenibacillus tengchongensis TaxID=2608684 RepID=UPI00124D6586|nr:GNAT family N-acetyltransferase [Paenibacillus tengchongensis]